MKLLRSYQFFLLVLISSSCMRPLLPTKESADDRITIYDEDLSVVRPRYAERPTSNPPRETTRPRPTTQPNTPRPPVPAPSMAINTEVDKAVNRMAERNKSITTTQGYRIQVFSANNKAEYEQARSYLLQYFPSLETYVSYSQPTYRIKVGDFLTREDAEASAAELRTRFVGTKVIVDTIDYKKGLQQKYFETNK